MASSKQPLNKMQKFKRSFMSFAAAIAVIAGLAAIAGPIVAKIGPVPAVIINSTTAFAADHVARPFNAVTLTQDGQPYRPNGPNWIGFTTASGQRYEDAAENFTIRQRDVWGRDGLLASGYRVFPSEAVDPPVQVKVGDSVRVESLRQGLIVPATVTAVNLASSTVELDFPAQGGSGSSIGDSGSLVRTAAGGFVGVVSAAVLDPERGRSRSSVSVPPPAPVLLPGNGVVAPAPQVPDPIVTLPINPVPAPVNPSPVPVPIPVITAEQYYRNGIVEGRRLEAEARRQALDRLAVDLQAILERVRQ